MPTRSRMEKLCWNNFLCSQIFGILCTPKSCMESRFSPGLERINPWRQSLERAAAIRKPSNPPIKMPDANAVLGYPVM